MLISRRNMILGATSIIACGTGLARAATAGVTLGAIRWDPWYEPQDSGIRLTMEHVLDAEAWRSRAPSCATIANGKMDFGLCSTKSQIDFEIQAAHDARIDYWAFCWYGADNAMQEAWRLYHKSRLNTLIKWCIIMGAENLNKETPTDIPGLVKLLQDTTYQTVASGRPLLYIIHDDTSGFALRPKIDALRAACKSAGIASPYIVLLFGASKGAIAVTGADAVGIYSKPNAAPRAAPYASLVASTEAYWRTIAETGQSMIPTALTGADRRPRIERPVPWEAERQKPFDGDENYYKAGSPVTIAAHVRDMVQWIASNKAACPAQTGLIYSWNEHDEGGSTLNPSLGDGDAILKALKDTLREGMTSTKPFER